MKNANLISKLYNDEIQYNKLAKKLVYNTDSASAQEISIYVFFLLWNQVLDRKWVTEYGSNISIGC